MTAILVGFIQKAANPHPPLLHQHPSLKLEMIFDYAKKRYYPQYYQDIPEPVICTMMPSGIDNHSNDTYTEPENH
jgi:hypothetical protein